MGPFEDGREGAAALEQLIRDTFGAEENVLLAGPGGADDEEEEEKEEAALLDRSALADSSAAAQAAAAAAAASPTAASLPLRLVPRPNSTTAQAHRLTAPPAAPLTVVQHPLLSQVSLSLGCKRPLAEYRTGSRADYATALLDYVLSSVFDARVSALRQASARPAFLGVGWDDWPAPSEGCGFRTLSVFAEAVDEALTEEGGPGGAFHAAADASAGPPAPAAWRSAPLTRWQAAVCVGVREALRLARFGVPPNELRLALAACLKSVTDRAAAADSVDSAELMSDLQVGVAAGGVWG